MKKKIIVLLLNAMLFTPCFPVDVKPTKVPRIGLVALLQYSNLYYVAPVLFRAQGNFFHNLSNIGQKPPPSQRKLK